MLWLLKMLFKMLIFGAILFAVSQITIRDKKLYEHAETIVAKNIMKYTDIAEKKIYKSTKRKIKKYLKKKIANVIDKKKKSIKESDTQIMTKELNMDEKELIKILEN